MRALLLLLLLMLPGSLAAHEVRPAIATATVAEDGGFKLEITLNLEAVMAGIEPDHSDTNDSQQAPTYDRMRSLEPDRLRAEFEAFAPRFLAGVSLAPAGHSPAPLRIETIAVPPVGDLDLPRLTELVLAGRLPAGTQSVVWSYAPSFGDSVIRLKKSGAGELFHSAYVTGGTSDPIALDGAIEQGWLEVFTNYAELGFIHIVPKGADHIFFVVGLFLLSTRLSALLWQVTAFTLAHTVTLFLGVTGLVTISPQIVEPLIAASIVFIAVENLFTTRLHAWRPVVVFCFGLLHGLGFAGVLREIGLSANHFLTGLIAFNIGVELGQLAVIAACFALVGWAMRRPDYRKLVVVPGSLAIAVVAAIWFSERLFV